MSLTFEDVLSFPEDARMCLSCQPGRYQQFIDVIYKYSAEQYESFACQLMVKLVLYRQKTRNTMPGLSISPRNWSEWIIQIAVIIWLFGKVTGQVADKQTCRHHSACQ